MVIYVPSLWHFVWCGNKCVGATAGKRAGLAVRRLLGSVPFTLPSVHQCSLGFSAGSLSLRALSLCVFIRLTGAVSAVTVLLILTLMSAKLTPPVWHLVQIWKAQLELLLQNPFPPHDVSSVRDHRVQTLALEFLCPNISCWLPFSSHPPPMYLLHCLTEYLSCSAMCLLSIWICLLKNSQSHLLASPPNWGMFADMQTLLLCRRKLILNLLCLPESCSSLLPHECLEWQISNVSICFFYSN